MANSKLIVVEGAQGAGKTTVTDFIRNSLKYTNLYRLNGTNDNTITGLVKSEKMYYNLLDYIKNLENLGINLVFDRTFFTEENYCRLGKKEYSFTNLYEKLLEEFSKLDFEIYYITLYLENEHLFEERLEREGKVVTDYSKYGMQNSILQQREYLKMFKEIEEKYPNINTVKISTDREKEYVQRQIREFIGF